MRAWLPDNGHHIILYSFCIHYIPYRNHTLDRIELVCPMQRHCLQGIHPQSTLFAWKQVIVHRGSNTSHKSRYYTTKVVMSAHQDEDPLLQYVALRRDLWKEHNWPLGSIVAQGCHAATAALWVSRDSTETAEYCSAGNLDHMRKVWWRVDWMVHYEHYSIACVIHIFIYRLC